MKKITEVELLQLQTVVETPMTTKTKQVGPWALIADCSFNESMLLYKGESIAFKEINQSVITLKMLQDACQELAKSYFIQQKQTFVC